MDVLLAGVIFALALAYAGRTLPGNIYFKIKDVNLSDGIAYSWMALITAPALGLLSVATLPAFVLMFAPSPAKYHPFKPKGWAWFPVKDRRWEIASTILFPRYTWGSVGLAAIAVFVHGPLGALLAPACGVTMAAGYVLGSLLPKGGDMHGKLCAGFLTGILLYLAF